MKESRSLSLSLMAREKKNNLDLWLCAEKRCENSGISRAAAKYINNCKLNGSSVDDFEYPIIIDF